MVLFWIQVRLCWCSHQSGVIFRSLKSCFLVQLDRTCYWILQKCKEYKRIEDLEGSSGIWNTWKNSSWKDHDGSYRILGEPECDLLSIICSLHHQCVWHLVGPGLARAAMYRTTGDHGVQTGREEFQRPKRIRKMGNATETIHQKRRNHLYFVTWKMSIILKCVCPWRSGESLHWRKTTLKRKLMRMSRKNFALCWWKVNGSYISHRGTRVEWDPPLTAPLQNHSPSPQFQNLWQSRKLNPRFRSWQMTSNSVSKSFRPGPLGSKRSCGMNCKVMIRFRNYFPTVRPLFSYRTKCRWSRSWRVSALSVPQRRSLLRPSGRSSAPGYKCRAPLNRAKWPRRSCGTPAGAGDESADSVCPGSRRDVTPPLWPYSALIRYHPPEFISLFWHWNWNYSCFYFVFTEEIPCWLFNQQFRNWLNCGLKTRICLFVVANAG